MAITARAARNFDFAAKSGNGDRVGPGSYSLEQKRLHRVNPVPFGQSAKRPSIVPNDSKGASPGPGEYTITNSLRASSAGACQPFRSAVKRFDFVVQDGPGPGAYGAHQEWHTHQQSRKKSAPAAPRKPYVGYQTVPTIPAPDQTHGYEENDEGELVLQPPPERSGDIEFGIPVGTSLSDTHAVHWSRSRSGRTKFVPSEAPGPGAYEATAHLNAATPATAAFRSTASKHWNPATDAPGPGAYNPPVTVEVNYARPHGCFGTTSSRGIDMKIDDNPGPGTALSV